MYKNRKFGKNTKSLKDTKASETNENKRHLDPIDENASAKFAVSMLISYMFQLGM